jgi:hypothetical protein
MLFSEYNTIPGSWSANGVANVLHCVACYGVDLMVCLHHMRPVQPYICTWPNKAAVCRCGIMSMTVTLLPLRRIDGGGGHHIRHVDAA